MNLGHRIGGKAFRHPITRAAAALIAGFWLVAAAASSADARPAAWKPSRANKPKPVPEVAAPPEEADFDAAPSGPERYPAVSDAQASAAPGEKRAAPNYAPSEPSSLAQTLLWVPRVALFPIYAISEYIVRRPLVTLATLAEERRLPEHVIDLLTFGPNDEATIWPVFYLDLGFQPHAGLSFSWDPALSPRNAVHVRADTGGSDWFRVRAQNTYALTTAARIELGITYAQRSDLAFWGFGPESPASPLRYGSAAAGGSLAFSLSGWRWSEWMAGVELASQRFDTSAAASEDASLDEAVASGRLEALPPGTDGYSRLSPTLRILLDTRHSRLRKASDEPDFVAPPSTGVLLAARARYSFAFDAPRNGTAARQWLGYGGVAGAYLDLTGTQRTVGLTLSTDFVRSTSGNADVPFAEQPALGGSEPMAGLRSRRLVGPSAVTARVEYRWPIWVSLDGTANAALGNVFGPDLAGFDPELLRASFALGIRTIASQNQSFEIVIGAGTTPLRSGADLEEVRFGIGTSSPL
jgi:hypothetical protein